MTDILDPEAPVTAASTGEQLTELLAHAELTVRREQITVHSADPESPAYIKDEARRVHICVITREIGGVYQLLWSPMHISHGDPWFAGYRDQLRRAGIVPEPVQTDLAEIQSFYTGLDNTEHRAASGSVDASAEERAIHFLRAAQKLQASDLRIIVYRGLTTLRIRRLGRGQHLATLTAAEGLAIINVIYGSFCFSQHDGVALDPNTTQDAAIDAALALEHGIPEGRVNTHPRDANGIQITIRLQADNKRHLRGIEEHGFLPEQNAMFDEMLSRKQGAIYFSGPVGSGKSTALMSLAERLSDMDPGLDIITIEDPIEYRSSRKNIMALPRVLPWEQEISSMVRQAPDVLIPSEIRTSEAAVAAVDMASGGVMVLTTVHCNDAFAVPRRLMEKFKVDKETLLDPEMLSGLVHMRLVNRVCQHCCLPLDGAGKAHVPAAVMERMLAGLKAANLDADLSGVRVTNPEGCDKCRTIRPDRIAVADVVVPNGKLVDLLGRKRGATRAKAHWLKNMHGITKTAHLLRHILAGKVCPITAERDLWGLDRDAKTLAEMEDLV